MAMLLNLSYLCNQQVAEPAEVTEYGAPEYKPPPGRKRTQARNPEGSRGNSCNVEEIAPLTLLVPEDHVPLTTNRHPTFFWYLNTTLAVPMRLTIYQPGQPSPIYVQNWLPTRRGIFAFKLPATVNPLLIGQQYRWTVSIICNREQPSYNIFAKAWIERVKKPVNMSNYKGSSCLKSYAESGIWYDALSCQPKFSAEFWSLLAQVGLTMIEPETALITLY